jgi:hypothetical protein
VSPLYNLLENSPYLSELDFFPSLKPTGYFFQFKLIFFSSFMARVKYFDGLYLTIYSLSTIYSFWSGGFTTATAMNKKGKKL